MNADWEKLNRFFDKHREKLAILQYIADAVNGAEIVFVHEGPIVKYRTSVYTTVEVTIKNGKVYCNRKEVASLCDPDELIEKIINYIENEDGLRPDIFTI